VIEEIEGLRTELKMGTLAEPEVLQQAEINPFGTWAEETPNSTAAEVTLSRGKGAGGEPLRLSFGEVNGRDLIRPRDNICIRTHHSQTAGIGSRRISCRA
jgi:hypothetical protein